MTIQASACASTRWPAHGHRWVLAPHRETARWGFSRHLAEGSSPPDPARCRLTAFARVKRRPRPGSDDCSQHRHSTRRPHHPRHRTRTRHDVHSFTAPHHAMNVHVLSGARGGVRTRTSRRREGIRPQVRVSMVLSIPSSVLWSAAPVRAVSPVVSSSAEYSRILCTLCAPSGWQLRYHYELRSLCSRIRRQERRGREKRAASVDVPLWR